MAHTHQSGIIAKRSAVFRYGVAAVAVAAATAVRVALEPVLGLHSPYLPFTLAVIVASLFGGRGPGLAATALSLVAVDYFFLGPRYAFGVSDVTSLAGLALFAVIGTIISFLVGQLRQSLVSSALKSVRLEELNTALEMAHAMVRTPGGVITYWSRGAAAMYGWSPDEAIGQRYHDLLKTEFPEPFRKIQERLMERGYWEGELRHQRRDGSIVVAASHWSLQRDEQGRPSAVVEVNNDITAVKQAEEALQQKTALVNYSHDAIIAADQNRVITAWNTGAEETYGWTEAEAVGNVMHRLFHTGSSVSIAEIDRILARDGRWDRELVHTRRDGKQIIVESRQILRRDAAGVPIGILEINRDISDRKRLEDQFRQAQKLEGIGRLAGGVAHDFNNLLTIISGYAQTVLDDLGAQHPLRGPMEQISKAATRATNLTRQLLIFSRRQVSESRNIVLNELVRDFEKMLRRIIGEDIDLVLSLDPNAGVLRADAGQIEQVILNLAVNAKDAMPKGGTLSIETSSLHVDAEFAQKHLSVQPGLYVVLVVTDTGIGMSLEVKSHLFEPFFTTKEAGKGTGLGLSTVYGILKQSGGSIWAYSEPGRGTVFRMLFPAVQAEAAPAPPAPAKVSVGNETILLAEDEPDVHKFTRMVLERHGYSLSTL